MSGHIEEFDAIRKAAYAHINVHGKDAAALRAHCETIMSERRQEQGVSAMSDREARELITTVVNWTIRRYNPPRWKPQRSREERAGNFLVTPEAFKMAAEQYGKSTLRNTARLTGQSKSTVGRHLVRHGIAPRRTAKIKKLSDTAQRLVGILDATFDRKAAGLLQLGELASALWDGENRRVVPKSTQASRVKKLKTLLSEVSQAGLGYHTANVGALVGVFRGRRFPSLSEAVTWVEEEQRLNRYPLIERPTPTQNQIEYFWADPIVKDVIDIMRMSDSGHFYPIERMDAIFRFKRPLLDLTPLWPWLERAYHSDYGDNMGENLYFLAHNITDPVVRKAAEKLARLLQDLKGHMGMMPKSVDAFATVDFLLNFMDNTAVKAPDSHARLAYIRHVFETTAEYFEDDEPVLSTMLDREKSGEWVAPDAKTLAQYYPALAESDFLEEQSDKN